ncbi:MAG: TIR domain-containing protein [Anaerolineae bacterium]|nr:TIR domain-containing protein [Anaerolineae bacterium]
MRKIRDVLQAAQFTVWTDENIEVGTRSWMTAIEEAIENAGCLVCVLSPDSKKSQWVMEEVHHAELHKKPIYMILARGGEQSSVPFGFTTTQWIDLRESVDYSVDMQGLIQSVRARFQAVQVEPTPATPIPPKQQSSASLQLATVESQKESARLQVVLSELTEGVMVFDGTGRIVLMNPSARHIWGSNKGFWESETAKDIGQILKAYGSLLDREAEQRLLNLPRSFKFGDRVFAQQVIPLAHHNGTLGYIIVLSDISLEANQEAVQTEISNLRNEIDELRKLVTQMLARTT